MITVLAAMSRWETPCYITSNRHIGHVDMSTQQEYLTLCVWRNDPATNVNAYMHMHTTNPNKQEEGQVSIQYDMSHNSLNANQLIHLAICNTCKTGTRQEFRTQMSSTIVRKWLQQRGRFCTIPSPKSNQFILVTGLFLVSNVKNFVLSKFKVSLLAMSLSKTELFFN